jgi:hypothetical protein
VGVATSPHREEGRKAEREREGEREEGSKREREKEREFSYVSSIGNNENGSRSHEKSQHPP